MSGQMRASYRIGEKLGEGDYEQEICALAIQSHIMALRRTSGFSFSLGILPCRVVSQIKHQKLAPGIFHLHARNPTICLPRFGTIWRKYHSPLRIP
jgi:hypothetical protein